MPFPFRALRRLTAYAVVVFITLGAAWVLDTRGRDAAARQECRAHVRLLTDFVRAEIIRYGPPADTGRALLERLDERLPLAFGGGRRMICEDDENGATCSYATRDFTRFPLTGDRSEWLVCERAGHHVDGLFVGLVDGSVQFVTREELGLDPDEPIVVGPQSTCEPLSQMTHDAVAGETAAVR